MAHPISLFVVIVWRFYSVLATSECTRNCGIGFQTEWASIITGSKINDTAAPTIQMLLTAVSAGPFQADPDKSADSFLKLCDAYLRYDDCLEGCPSCPLKEFIMNGTLPFRHLCGRRRQVHAEVMPCLTSNRNLLQKECYDQFKNTFNAGSSLKQMYSLPLSIRPNLFKEYCEATASYMNCHTSAVNETCGHDAAIIMGDLMMLSLDRVRRLTESATFNSPVPTECGVLFSNIPDHDDLGLEDRVADAEKQTGDKEDHDDSGAGSVVGVSLLLCMAISVHFLI